MPHERGVRKKVNTVQFLPFAVQLFLRGAWAAHNVRPQLVPLENVFNHDELEPGGHNRLDAGFLVYPRPDDIPDVVHKQ